MMGVIGATGNVGSMLVPELVRAGEEVVAVSSSGGEDGPRLRHAMADVRQPDTIASALRGATGVFVLAPVRAPDFDAAALIRAIESTGAERIVVLSSMGAVSRPKAEGYESLRKLEGATRDSRRAITILRPTGFASNTLAWVPSIRASHEVHAPFGDVAIPIVDPADIAAIAAVALRTEGHAGKIYDLTGPAPITPRAQAQVLADALGATITFRELTREEAAAGMRAHIPAPLVEGTLDIAGTPNEQERRVSPDIERILGRPASPYAAWVLRNLAAFRS